MKAIDQALGALLRDKVQASNKFNPQGIPKCLLLRYKIQSEYPNEIRYVNRAQLAVVGNEPKMALEDIKSVLKDEPEEFVAICTKVTYYLDCYLTLHDCRPSVCFYWGTLRRV